MSWSKCGFQWEPNHLSFKKRFDQASIGYIFPKYNFWNTSPEKFLMIKKVFWNPFEVQSYFSGILKIYEIEKIITTTFDNIQQLFFF